MWQIGDRLEAKSWDQHCDRCGQPKKYDTNFNARYIEHQVDDCIWSLKKIVVDDQKRITELQNQLNDLLMRVKELESSPLDRLAKEAP